MGQILDPENSFSLLENLFPFGGLPLVGDA